MDNGTCEHTERVMAVIRLADYYDRHLRRIKLVSVALLLAITISLAASLWLSGFGTFTELLYILLPVVMLQIFAMVVILKYALEPLDILTRAITHTSSQANDVTPPKINEPRHEKTGLKMMVQTVYDRAASQQTTDGTAAPTQAAPAQLIDLLPCGIIALDASKNIVYTNQQAPIVPDQNGNKAIELLFDSGDTLQTWLDSSEKNKMSDSRTWARIQNRLPDAEGRRIFDVSVYYQQPTSESTIETIILTIDRTAFYATNEEDMDFIALAAHELRGPITVIRGYLDVLLDELDPVLQGDQKELLNRLSVSANRLSGYVSNILNVSRYDRRHLKLHLREDKLSDIYATIADDLQLRASTQNRLLSINIPIDLPTVAADRNSLSEVLANLVDNAIKYSNEGGQVAVTAAVDGNYVKCSVQDHGIGIPGSVVGNLFSKFYRSHRSRQTVAGTGLGLYISKGIIESHGGQIGLKSKEGEGSIFTFSVPIYSTVADKLLSGDNKDIIESSSGWIKNHAMFRG